MPERESARARLIGLVEASPELISGMREDDLIQRISRAFGRSVAPGFGLNRGIGDDAAFWRASPGTETILTCDWFLEGTHFMRGKHPPDSVGWKCLARAMSDVAAMGGAPKCFLLSLALPPALAGSWLDEFLRGLRRASQKFACQLAGGDTTRWAQVLISITVLGEVTRGLEILRTGARPRDLIFTSGRLGEAELGLRLIRDSHARRDFKNRLFKKHLYPEPRIALGRWLATNRVATAMMDISDGLSSDLPRLCAASGVGARIWSAKIPKLKIPAVLARHNLDALELALHGGDDYALLFTARPKSANSLRVLAPQPPVTCIGEITRQKKILLVRGDGTELPLPAKGWDPFRTQS